jgi:phosphoribosylamine---glycine ligase
MDKRKFLFVSLSGLIGDIAWQVLKEGHDVRYYIEAEKERDIADGFVPKSKDWEKDAKWSDIIVFDDTLGQGAKAQALRAAGKPVIGGTPYADRLEDDRSFGQEQLKSAGVSIIPYEDFDSFDPAIEFVKKNPDRYVIKPSGEAQNVKRRLFVGEEEDGEDVIRMQEAYKKAFSEEIKVFQLQRRINGVEVPSALSSTARNSSRRSTSTSSTKTFSPAKSGRLPAKWAPLCSGASPTCSLAAPFSKWNRNLPRKATSATST